MNKKLEHPYHDLTNGFRLRGNLHAHTQRSDGLLSPEEVIQAYRGKGYDFLMISDHDIFATREWLDGLDRQELIYIPGNEISANGRHLLHVNATSWIAPNPQRQVVLNGIAAEPQSFAIMAHPNWQGQFDYATIGQLREWVGYAGIEIYNGVISRLGGSAYATNKWDMLLSDGFRCWGYANDDSHCSEDVALGWNVVFVREKTSDAIVDALRNGRFYASSGVEIENIVVEGLRIHLRTRNADRIAAVCDEGKRFAQVDAAELEVEVPEDVRYVRFECWGRGEQMAWSQPFYVV